MTHLLDVATLTPLPLKDAIETTGMPSRGISGFDYKESNYPLSLSREKYLLDYWSTTLEDPLTGQKIVCPRLVYGTHCQRGRGVCRLMNQWRWCSIVCIA